jgi:hypothetical protein
LRDRLRTMKQVQTGLAALEVEEVMGRGAGGLEWK